MQTESFAKLFESQQFGQILVTLDSDDDLNPTVRFTISGAPLGMGLCAVGPVWAPADDSDEAEDRAISEARQFFDSVELEDAERFAESLQKEITNLFGGIQ